MADFTQLYPDIDLSLTVRNGIAPPDPRFVDAGIWHRRIDERGFRSEPFSKDQVIAVSSPEFQSKYDTPTSDRLQDAPLLHFNTRSWSEFFHAAGLTRVKPGHGPSFDDAASLLNAALAGLGVAMIREQLARAFLRSGALVQVGSVQIQAHLSGWADSTIGLLASEGKACDALSMQGSRRRSIASTWRDWLRSLSTPPC